MNSPKEGLERFFLCALCYLLFKSVCPNTTMKMLHT